MAEINIEIMAQNVAEKTMQKLRDSGVFIGRWIPVSEGLPEDNKTYLVTVELTFARGERYVSQERKDNWDKLKGCGHEIIAWMPLPEPYDVESEG